MTAINSPIAIPDSRLARQATELIRSVEPALLCNHSLRAYRRHDSCALIRASQFEN